MLDDQEYVLLLDPGLVPSSYTEWFSITVTPVPGKYNVCLWPPWVPGLVGTLLHTHTHMKINLFYK